MKPMTLSFYPTGIGTIPKSPLKLSNTDCVTINAFKKADNGEGYIIRLFNPTEKSQNCILHFYDAQMVIQFGKYEIKFRVSDGVIEVVDVMIK